MLYAFLKHSVIALSDLKASLWYLSGCKMYFGSFLPPVLCLEVLPLSILLVLYVNQKAKIKIGGDISCLKGTENLSIFVKITG